MTGAWLVPGTIALLALATTTAACSSPSANSLPDDTATSQSRVESTPPTQADLARFYEQVPAWQDCGGGFDCSTVAVPVDYTNPSGATIDLAVTRLKTAHPQGSLLLNPGGPGVSGVELARAAEAVTSPALRGAFDIVGFDPRGVGESAPVDCLSDPDLDAFLAADWTPDSPAEVAALQEEALTLGQGCMSLSPELAGHVGTADAARDMDVLRAVLGDDHLNYLGWSYGSYLGQAYLALFPHKAGRIVLDGILPLGSGLDAWYRDQSAALDSELRRFVEDCLDRSRCPLTGTVDEGVRQIQTLLAGLDAQPIPGWDDRVLTESMALTAILAFLYQSPDSWADLREALEAALSGDAGPMFAVLDVWLQRDPMDHGFSTNMYEASWAVNCLDTPATGGVDHAATSADDWSTAAPVFGRYSAFGTLTCWQWPATGEALAGMSLADVAETVLLVSTTNDPATPHAWGQQVEAAIPHARLLTHDGDGHTAYRRGSMCIDDAVDAYLVEGTLPPEGTICPGREPA